MLICEYAWKGPNDAHLVLNALLESNLVTEHAVESHYPNIH